MISGATMRLRRPSTLLAASLSSLLLASACGTGGETGVGGDLGPNPSPESTAAADGLALRAPGGGPVPADGDGQGAVTARPSPPTLSTGADPGSGAGGDDTPQTSPPPAASVATTSSTTPDSGEPATNAQPTATGDTVAGASSSVPTNDPVVAAPADAAAELAVGEARSFTLLEDLRLARGLTGLTRDPEMDAFARDWSRQMAESGQLEHSSGPYGENIAFTADTELSAAEAAELFHQLWLGNPGHYDNMVNDGYLTAGIGLYLTEQGWYGTHVFAL